MCLACLVAIGALSAAPQESDLLRLTVEVTPTKARLGDGLFLRISVRNAGASAVLAPHACLLENGTLCLELHDDPEDTVFQFLPEGCPFGGDGERVPLQPGKTRMLSLRMVLVPRIEDLRLRFWSAELWREGKYRVRASCAGLSAFGPDVLIERRPDAEMRRLRQFYGAGPRAPWVRDWPLYRPSLDTFYLFLWPRQTSQPENLADLEKALTPGTLRDIVHATRLTQAVHDGNDLAGKRQATTRLLQWLDAQHEIARHWMAGALVSWAQGNQSLREYGFEFIDQVIARLPQSEQGKARRANGTNRQRYLEYLRQQRQPRKN